MEERERFPGNCDWEFGVVLSLRISLMANASHSGEMHHAGQSARAPKVAELADLY